MSTRSRRVSSIRWRTQTCRQVVPDVQACAYKEYAELADSHRRRRAAGCRRGSAGVLDDVVFLQHFDNDTRQLQADVRAAIDGRVPRLPSHALRIRFFSHPKNFDAARLRMAAYAVGLPTETGEDRIGRVVAGEARGVIVLWLASRGLTGKHLGRFVNEAEVHEPEDNDATYRGGDLAGDVRGRGRGAFVGSEGPGRSPAARTSSRRSRAAGDP